MSGKCQRVAPEPEPQVVLAPPPKKRARKASVGESLQLIEQFENSGMTKKFYCREVGIQRHRLNAALATRDRLFEQKGIDFLEPTAKERKSRSFGSGLKAADDYVITPVMNDHLIDFMKNLRGLPHETHKLYNDMDQNLYDKDGLRLPVSYEELVDEISVQGAQKVSSPSTPQRE